MKDAQIPWYHPISSRSNESNPFFSFFNFFVVFCLPSPDLSPPSAALRLMPEVLFFPAFLEENDKPDGSGTFEDPEVADL